MFKVKIEKLNTEKINELTRVVSVSKYKGKYVFCQHKERDTWEIPGGHIEEGETWEQALERELYEETGAIKIKSEPISLYKISTYGLLCYTEILELDDLPDSEIEKIGFFDEIPENLTYPESHTLFFNTVLKSIEDRK